MTQTEVVVTCFRSVVASLTKAVGDIMTERGHDTDRGSGDKL